MEYKIKWCCESLQNWEYKTVPPREYLSAEDNCIAFILSGDIQRESLLFIEINKFKYCPFCKSEIVIDIPEELKYNLYLDDDD